IRMDCHVPDELNVVLARETGHSPDCAEAGTVFAKQFPECQSCIDGRFPQSGKGRMKRPDAMFPSRAPALTGEFRRQRCAQTSGNTLRAFAADFLSRKHWQNRKTQND
ncbi:MAG: hypothetical protein VB858_06735, partial [Planctomycetaceae bacterium]